MSASRHLIRSSGSSGISLSTFARLGPPSPRAVAEKDHFGDSAGHRDHHTGIGGVAVRANSAAGFPDAAAKRPSARATDALPLGTPNARAMTTWPACE
jgi:hypothetical protein